MYNFSAIVDNILLENQQTQTEQKLAKIIKAPPFLDVFAAFKSKYGIDWNTQIPQLVQALNLVAAAGQRYPARDVLAPAIPIMDLFETIHLHYVNQNDIKNKTSLDELLDIIDQKASSDQFIATAADEAKTKIINAATIDPMDWPAGAPKTISALNTLRAEIDSLSRTAIEQLGGDTILNALQKIITKRTTVSSRLMAGKGLRRPFQRTLLNPLFDNYKKYTTGGNLIYNKIPGDFKETVDQLSIDKVVNIAILTGEYYLFLLRKQLANQNQNQQNQQPRQQTQLNQQRLNTGRNAPRVSPPKAPGVVTASLTNFDALIKDLLNENQSSALTKQQYDNIVRLIGNSNIPDFVMFINQGKSQYLPETQQQQGQQQQQRNQQGQQQQKQTGPIIYNLDTISKDPSKEATDLYKALRDIAYNTRETSGFAYRSQQAGKAAGALASFGGAKLYGGPGT